RCVPSSTRCCRWRASPTRTRAWRATRRSASSSSLGEGRCYASLVRVKGSALKARLQYVQERGGDDAYRRFVADLAPGTRALVEGGLLATEWYPFECFMNLCEAADAHLGSGDLALCVDMGRYACDVNLTT